MTRVDFSPDVTIPGIFTTNLRKSFCNYFNAALHTLVVARYSDCKRVFGKFVEFFCQYFLALCTIFPLEERGPSNFAYSDQLLEL